MCLAVPMQISLIRDAGMALGTAEGMQSEINLSLLEDPSVGDYVIVHAGFAIEKLDEQEALERLKLFAELAEVMQR